MNPNKRNNMYFKEPLIEYISDLTYFFEGL